MVILNKQPKEQVDRVLRLPLEHDTQKNKNANGIPLAITYNPAFRNLSTTLQKNFNILYLDPVVRTVLRQVLFLLIEELESFSEVKTLSIRKNSGFFKISSIL